MNSRRIGIFGGTFDPVHIGHLIMAVELRHALDLDRVLFVPAGDPPHKPFVPITAARHRIRMLELALAGHGEFVIDRVDVDRPGPSYTKDTLAMLKPRFPNARLFFLMGADSLRDLETWSEPERILHLAELGVAARPGAQIDLESTYRSLPAARGRIVVVETPLIDISSSDIRDRVAAGMPIAFQAPEAVERYIRDNQLYCSLPAV